ncbi:MAG: dipeptidyl-peptidase-4 [Acidimicrobiales bacterium]
MDFPLQHARTRRFTLGTPRNLSVSTDGARVLFLRAKTANDPVLCLWSLDVADGEETLVVDPAAIGRDSGGEAANLPPEERARRERARESASGIVSYALDRHATCAVFALGGDLFSCDLASHEVTALTTDEGVFDPRLDPTGTTVGYVSGNTFRLIDTARPGTHPGGSRELVSDDDPLISWGRAEFIAAEEMQRSRGFWWAPDGESLLLTRVDNTVVDRWFIGDPANPASEPVQVRYPAAGTNNAKVGLWWATREGLGSEIDWSDNGRYEYLCDVVWSSDHDPMVVRQTRDQRTVDIARLPAGSSGPIISVHTITDDVWVELIPGSPSWCDRGLLTIEDDQDHRRLCLDGRPITGDDVEVRSIIGLTEDGGRAVVTAWTDPTEIHVVSVALDGSKTTHITSAPGVHGAVLGGKTMVVSSSVPEQPGTTLRVGGLHQPGSTVIADHAATPVLLAKPQFVGVGDELRSAVFFPTDHDGRTPLPVLLDPYGGPHAQRVLKNHTSHLVSQWFADQGFAVVVTDGRGTPGRGPRFERAVWGDLAQPVLDDQLSALDRIAADTGLLDLERVGIRGWSFGGYLAALAVLRRPDRVHAAIAGAPVTSWHLYDTHYTERYLGHPQEHADHYDQTNLIREAASLTRPLLLIHGLADDNVVAAHTLQLSTALLGVGRPHAILPLSGVTHMTPQESIAQNLLLVQQAFLVEHLGAGPTAGRASGT